MKIATLLAVATVALAKHHHRHDRTPKAIVKDIDIDDNNNDDINDNDFDDLFVSQKAWNVAGTLNLVKKFEGLRLTAY